MSGWRLLLTRPDEECAALAASLGEAGVHSSSLPLLAIDPMEETPEQRTLMLGLDRYCAEVVVSKPAARLGLERLDRYWPQPPQQTWCSVGAATAAILEAYGLDVTYPEQGDDSEALLALPAFQDSLRVHDPKVLIMRGEGGRDFLAARLRQGDSPLFLARDAEARALGFVQLYPLFASLALRPSWLLSDLYVRPEARRRGVGEALMNQARGCAESMGACGLQLETAKTNHAGQSLYERLGYVRDEQFYTYRLQL